MMNMPYFGMRTSCIERLYRIVYFKNIYLVLFQMDKFFSSIFRIIKGPNPTIHTHVFIGKPKFLPSLKTLS